MNTIDAQVQRVGKWWAVELPIHGHVKHTQGRTLTQAQHMVEDLRDIWAEELHDSQLAATPVTLHIVGEAGHAAQAVNSAKKTADDAAAQARAAQHDAVRSLLNAGITMTDIGKILGLTKGRISQLARA
ncbi:MAG: hypothetical protein SPI12_06980 [Actinomycetaceae bacterium]|nr:hypothetical protein [Actinomycetaceae bacterium]MDY6083578.1 hypothetical protein [Actinomycetaceae bacterium]